MKFKNDISVFSPINWVKIYLPLLFLCAAATFVYFKVSAKLEVCRTYYSEISTKSCVLSDYGLPSRGGK